jgi:hypothetical protein
MQGPFALLANLPGVATEALFWLSVIAGVTIVHHVLNATLAPRNQVAAKSGSRK